VSVQDLNTILSLIFSGVVSAATIVIAWATHKYMKLTASLVEETKLVRKAQTEPKISIFLRPQEQTPVIVDLIIQNYSQAQALDLTFQIEPDIYYYENRKLSDVDFLQCLTSLQPSETRILPMWTGYWKPIDGTEEKIPETVTFVVRYHDALGNEKVDRFPLPFGTYSHGETWGGNSPLEKIAKSLGELEKNTKQFLMAHPRKGTEIRR
jgi:hypothetical protein